MCGSVFYAGVSSGCPLIYIKEDETVVLCRDRCYPKAPCRRERREDMGSIRQTEGRYGVPGLVRWPVRRWCSKAKRLLGRFLTGGTKLSMSEDDEVASFFQHLKKLPSWMRRKDNVTDD